MDNLNLQQLIKDLDCRQIGSSDVPISRLANDSRNVQPGTVFIAIPGYSTDGHKYIRQAVEAGAVAVVAQYPVPDLHVPQIIVRNTRSAQAKMAAAFHQHPSRQLNLVGITGTNGKTTCTFMIDSILQASGLSTGLMGTLYNKIKGQILPTVNTTPDSILCQQLLREMVDAQVSHVTMEVSSHAMVMDRVAQTQFSVGAITNFSPDHLDLHNSMAEYKQAKKAFFDMLAKTATAVVNLDCPQCIDIAGETGATPLFYSLSNSQADLYLYNYRSQGTGAIISAKINTDKIPVSAQQIHFYLAVKGRHNIANALLSIATGLALNLDVNTIARGMGSYRGIYRRYETIYDGDFRVIDDATHNPANMDAVFQAVIAEGLQNIVIVYAIRGNRGVEINRSIAQTLNVWAQRIKPRNLIITRCDDTATATDIVKPAEEAIFRQELSKSAIPIHFEATLRQAVELALDSMTIGTTLLLLGGHPMDNVASLFSQLAGVETNIHPRPPSFGLQ